MIKIIIIQDRIQIGKIKANIKIIHSKCQRKIIFKLIIILIKIEAVVIIEMTNQLKTEIIIIYMIISQIDMITIVVIMHPINPKILIQCSN